MKTPNERQQLLDDVLSDTGDFRVSLLDATLHAVRRRRQTRQRNRWLLGITTAALAASALIVNPWLHPPALKSTDSAAAPPPMRLALVSSTPLRGSMLVESSADSVEFVNSQPETVMLVETRREGPRVREINDAELLALMARGTAAIVRPKGGPAELVVLAAADQAGVPPQ
jgi:hypothetical protein